MPAIKERPMIPTIPTTQEEKNEHEQVLQRAIAARKIEARKARSTAVTAQREAIAGITKTERELPQATLSYGEAVDALMTSGWSWPEIKKMKEDGTLRESKDGPGRYDMEQIKYLEVLKEIAATPDEIRDAA